MTYRMYAHHKGNEYFLQASESLARLKLVTSSEVTRWYNELQLSLPLNATKLVIELDGVTKIFQAKANASKFGWQRYRTLRRTQHTRRGCVLAVKSAQQTKLLSVHTSLEAQSLCSLTLSSIIFSELLGET